jgi:hypothetical protein
MNGWDSTAAYYSLSGATMLGFFVAALFFLRFWKRTRDRLFLLFASSFALMGGQRAAVLFFSHMDERTELALYSLRFVAFLVILVAIIDKNRVAGRAVPPGDSGSRLSPSVPREGDRIAAPHSDHLPQQTNSATLS